MTSDEVVEVLSIGMCVSAEARALCETCRRKTAAIDEVRRLAAREERHDTLRVAAVNVLLYPIGSGAGSAFRSALARLRNEVRS